MTTRPRVFPARILVARAGTSSSLARDVMLLSVARSRSVARRPHASSKEAHHRMRFCARLKLRAFFFSSVQNDIPVRLLRLHRNPGSLANHGCLRFSGRSWRASTYLVRLQTVRGHEMAPNFVRWFKDIGAGDTGSVGGKNASLGEMVRNLGPYGITVPPGFAITADAYRQLLAANNLEPLIAAKLAERKGGIFLAGLRWVKANGTNTPNLN